MLTTDQAKKLRFAGYAMMDIADLLKDKEVKQHIKITKEEKEAMDRVCTRVVDLLEREGQL